MKVTIYSHNYSVTDYNRYGYNFLRQFGISNFGEVDFRAIRLNKQRARNNPGSKPLPTIKRTFATSNSDGRTFRFHVNSLDKFKQAVANDPLLFNKVTYVTVDLYQPDAVELPVLPKYSPRDDQPEQIAYLEAPGTSKVLSLRTGGGKMQPVDEPVLTPTGWRRIGDLVPGDEVFTPKGTVSKVVQIFKHPEKQTFVFKTVDGRETEAGAEHLWTAHLGGLDSEGQMSLYNTEQIRQWLRVSKEVYIPSVKRFNGFKFTSKCSLPMDPFVYGLMNTLGINRKANVSVRASSELVVDTMYTFAESRGLMVTLSGPKNGRYMLVTSDAKGDAKHTAYTKLIRRLSLNSPEEERDICFNYMNNKPEVRQALLDGMLLGLKEKTPRGFYKGMYHTNAERVARDVCYLARSLGYSAGYKEVYSQRTTSGKKRYGITVSECPVDRIRVESVRKGKVKDCVCIAIDDPDQLYITRDFIVTHNTYCALQASSNIGHRVLISIETRFFNLWYEALHPDSPKQILNLTAEETLYVTGSKELKALLELALAKQLDDTKVIVVSSRTLMIYIETFERFGEDAFAMYPVHPIDFCRVLGVGVRIKDELHLSLHANFIEELYLHIPKSFSLSATLENGTFKDTILGIMFPMEYIDVTALMYRLREPNKARYTNRGSSDYSHNAYEQWIIKDKKRLDVYVEMIVDWLLHRYVKVRATGQRAAIFVTSVQMATIVTLRSKKAYKDLKIARYAASAGDVYEEARKADVLVTTVQSFGTGFDLDGLICSLLTTSINSPDTNIQVLGRLRELRQFPDVVPVFDYFVCVDIPRQMAYHEDKITLFKPRVKSHKVSHLNTSV